MSYLQFHLLFILPPILLLALGRKKPFARLGRWTGLGLPVMSLVALVYTTPWDNYLIRQGVWVYGEGRVLGTVGYVPLEEYLFFALQPLLAGLWLYRLLGREKATVSKTGPAARWAGATVSLALGLLGLAMLRSDPTYYLGLILAWASPVLAFQWAYGGHVLWARRRTFFLGVAVPTAYLWVADRAAMALGIWDLSERYTTGFAPFGLPVEEMAFFAITNLMVVQGLLLFLWVTERLRGRHRGVGAGALSRKETRLPGDVREPEPLRR